MISNRRYFIVLALITLLGSLLRLWQLGNRPQGLSPHEVKFGLWMGRSLGEVFQNEFVIRSVSSLFGILSIPVFYILIQKIYKHKITALLGTFILAILPWHIEQSRVLSLGTLLLFVIMVVGVYLYPRFNKYLNKVSLGLFLLSIFLLAASVINASEKSKSLSLAERNMIFRAGNSNLNQIAKIASREEVYSYRRSLDIVFSHLDPGMYFFGGHPRERSGVEESTKLPVLLMPLLLIGIVKLTRKELSMYVSLFTFFLSLLVFFDLEGPYVSLILVLPILLVAVTGIKYLYSNKRILVKILFVGILVESIFILTNYFSGYGESAFSPRKPIYSKLNDNIGMQVNNYQSIVVNSNLEDSQEYFKFFMGQRTLDKIKFEDLNRVPNRNKDTLYIDNVDPGDVNSPFSKLKVELNKRLKILHEIDDPKSQNAIIVYEVI